MAAIIILLTIQATFLSFNFLVRAQEAASPKGNAARSEMASQPALTANSGEKGTNESLYKMEGKATLYANRFHNKKTASGERYNKEHYSAAHKSLPFGTILRVTNQSSGKSVLVRINDRGPFRSKKIIDLSLASARKIGLKGSPSVLLEGFIPGSLRMADRSIGSYLMAFSESDSPAMFHADNVNLTDSVENFQDAVEMYKELDSAQTGTNHFIFVNASVFDDRNLRDEKIVYYIGCEKARKSSPTISKSIVKNVP